MTVEGKRGNLAREEEQRDRFPVGMRVLAVDDDPICLRILETLLRKCQYQVTTTNQAIMALKMLRENKNKYDLVISDVRMPDMDGFKLLELVGLEMDLPVIMLSAHGDTKLVMEGISHGACDYLLKPVRMEELKNIWQHVLRKKKKLGPKDQNKSPSQDQDQGPHENGEGGQDPAAMGSVDQNGKSNRKRKDQDEDEEEDGEDDENESEDPSSQKKPRVVWSVELHRKFVAAVNQLGIDKAVPKKILDLMDVEGLTRENVASHLQKYRLYLKRISTVASQQANLVAALGKDSSYLRMASLEGFRDFRTSAGPGRLSNTALSSYLPGGMFGRLNTPAGLSVRGFPSSDIIQSGQNSSSPMNTFGKLQPAVLPAIQNSNLFQGIPTTLGVDQLQQNKCLSRIGDFNPITEQTSFAVASSFPDSRTKIGSSSNIVSTVSSNPLMLQGSIQNTQTIGGFGNQSSVSLNPEPFKIGACGSSNFLDNGRCNENWTSAAQFSKFPSNSLPLSHQFNNDLLPSNSLSESICSSGPQIQSIPVNFPSTGALSAPLDDLRSDMQNQAGLIDNVVQNMNCTSKQRWEHNSNHAFSNLDSLLAANGGVGSLRQSLGQNSTVCTRNMDAALIGQLNGFTNPLGHHNEDNKSAMNTKMKSTEDYLDQMQSQSDFIQSGYDSLEDLMSAMIKREEQNETMLMDGEFGFDAYSLGSCI